MSERERKRLEETKDPEREDEDVEAHYKQMNQDAEDKGSDDDVEAHYKQ